MFLYLQQKTKQKKKQKNKKKKNKKKKQQGFCGISIRANYLFIDSNV